MFVSLEPSLELQELIVRQSTDGERRPRLHICSTGSFAHLPIHAACDLVKTQTEMLSHYAVVSYTPTLSILFHARRSLQPLRKHEARVLLAAVSRGFQWNTLHCAEEEAHAIRSVIPPHSFLHWSGLSAEHNSEKPDADNVLRKLPDANILHLSCHGYQSKQDPLASGFVMTDRMLTVEELMALHLPRSLFAFLSACETAKGDEDQPDEVVHLAATLLFAGFKSVIGTMW